MHTIEGLMTSSMSVLRGRSSEPNDSTCVNTPTGQPCYYYASDNLQSTCYRGLTPDDLIDIVVLNGLHLHGATQQGVVFHLVGALSEYGKVGLVCVGDSHQRSKRLYEETVAVLDRECGASTSN